MSTIHEFNKPIPVVIEGMKDGYAIYVESSGLFENDFWCVVLCDGGNVIHVNTSQIKIHHNSTIGINKNKS